MQNTSQPSPPTTTGPTAPPTTVAPSGQNVPPDSQVQAEIAALLTDPRFRDLFSTESRISALGVPANKVVDKTDPTRIIRYEGFQATDPNTGVANIPPKYFDGDQYVLATYGAEKQAVIINQLKKANYLTEKYVSGDPLTRPIAAMSALLTEANLTGQSWEQLLSFRQTNPVSGGTGGLQAYRVTSPTDLRAVFRESAAKVLGRRDIPREQLDRMISAYQQTEKSYQQQATGGGVVTQAPQATTFAEQRLETQNPDEAMAYRFAEYAQAFEKLLG